MKQPGALVVSTFVSIGVILLESRTILNTSREIVVTDSTIRVDGSSDEAFVRSTNRIRAELTGEKRKAFDEARRQIMPLTKKHSLKDLISACQAYPVEKRERITFEYVLLKGVTDEMKDAKALVKLLNKTKAKVNLIPFNSHSGLEFEAPNPDRVKEFQQYLLNHGLLATLRTSRGQGISAACGQLAAQSEKKDEPEAL